MFPLVTINISVVKVVFVVDIVCLLDKQTRQRLRVLNVILLLFKIVKICPRNWKHFDTTGHGNPIGRTHGAIDRAIVNRLAMVVWFHTIKPNTIPRFVHLSLNRNMNECHDRNLLQQMNAIDFVASSVSTIIHKCTI